MNNKKYTEKEIEFLKENYGKLGASFCSEKLNRSENSIRMKCSNLKIKITKEFRQFNSSLKKDKKSPNQYKVNPLQFLTPNDPVVVYILGLLWADGYIKSPYLISLSTTYPDADYFIPIFLKTGEWKYYTKTFSDHKTWKKSCTIKTSNRTLTKFLINNDYKIKSSESADKILSIIPDNLKHYWFRGLLDGDGCIQTNKKGNHNVSFSSSIDQNWNYLEELCKKLNITYFIKKEMRKDGFSSRFYIFGKYKTLKMCEYIYNGYENDGIGLRRKYEKFLFLKSIEEKNRFKGISLMKNGKWRAYTPNTQKIKSKHLGIFLTKEEALECVNKNL